MKSEWKHQSYYKNSKTKSKIKTKKFNYIFLIVLKTLSWFYVQKQFIFQRNDKEKKSIYKHKNCRKSLRKKNINKKIRRKLENKVKYLKGFKILLKVHESQCSELRN